jgi:hypothetical protein
MAGGMTLRDYYGEECECESPLACPSCKKVCLNCEQQGIADDIVCNLPVEEPFDCQKCREKDVRDQVFEEIILTVKQKQQADQESGDPMFLTGLTWVLLELEDLQTKKKS